MNSNNVSRDHKIPWKILIVAIFLNFCTWAFLFITPPMETILSTSLHISYFQVSLLFTAPILLIALAAIPAGIMADRIGLKKTIGIGAIIACVGAVLKGASTTYSGLLLFSLIFGFGMGCTFANLPKLARSCSSSQQTIFFMGLLTGFGVMAGNAMAMAITVPLIYPLVNSYNGVFSIWSLPLLIVTVLWWVIVREPPYSAESEFEEMGSTGLRDVLKNKILWLLAVLLLLHNMFFYTWTGWLPTYLLQKGASLSISGLLTSVMLWVGIPTVILLPMFFSRTNISKRILIWVPSLILAMLSIWLLYASIFSIWIIMTIAGIIIVLRFNTLLSLPVEIMPPQHAGLAGGVVVAIGYIGAVIGPGIAGQILDISGNFQTIFILLTVLSLLTLALTFLLPSNSNKKFSAIK